MNLISNSLDATPSWGTITLGCSVENGAAKVYVSDTGVGMSEETKDRIFEPFFTTKGVGGGTGLGLFICHRIVTEYEGEISVESEEGVGTTIRMTMPVVVDESQRREPTQLTAVAS